MSKGTICRGGSFHTLLTDAKFTGAYYTSVAAATLLARLTFERWPAGVDWTDHELPGSLNVADLACGTGTLLMAVASEVQRRHEAAGGRHAGELHKAMVEQALHGFDVQLSAVHFAATSLAMLNPRIQFDQMNLYTMPLGASGGDVRLGSLEFLGGDEAPVQMSLGGGALGIAGQDAERVSGSGGRGAAEGETADPAGTRSRDHESALHSIQQPDVRAAACCGAQGNSAASWRRGSSRATRPPQPGSALRSSPRQPPNCAPAKAASRSSCRSPSAPANPGGKPAS